VGWLDVADKVGSVVGAVTGILSVVIAVLALPGRPRRRGSGGRLRWILLALVCGAGLAVRFVPGVPARMAYAAGWAVFVLGLPALLLLAVRTHRRRHTVVLTEPLRVLLAAQGREVRYRYHFFGEYLPPLADIYVRPQVSVDEPWADSAEPVGGVGITDVLAAHDDVLLTGGPGAGKSTLVATLVREIAEGSPGRRGDVVAVAVPATDLVGRALPDALVLACRRDLRIEVPRELFESPPFAGGRWCVLVDGVDEVVDVNARWELLRDLRDAALGHSGGSRLLVTTRPLPGRELAALRHAGFRTYEMRPFSRKDLDAFADRWFAARMPGERQRARREAARFLALVTGARLGPVARVPLLTTIAAMVYEQADGAVLPSSRAALYQSFVAHLLDGRRALSEFWAELGPALHARGAPGRSLAAWFDAEFYDVVGALLDEVGTAWVADAATDPVAVAASWLRRHAPHDLTDVLPDGTRIVRELLRTTGLFVERHDRLAFAHQSFAEFFAARATAGRFDPGRWYRDVTNPATRSLAAFSAAVRPDADRLVGNLLGPAARGDPATTGDPVTAGDLIADGVPVSAATRAKVVDALVQRVRAEDESAPECLGILRELSIAADVLARLVALAEDGSAGSWARVYAADTVADVDHAAGVRLLSSAAASLPDGAARYWSKSALKARGVPVASTPWTEYSTVEVGFGQTLTSLARTSLAQVALDEASDLDRRIDAAARLAAGGDVEPLHGLADSVELDHLTRLRAAVALAVAGHDDRLVSFAGPPDEPRHEDSAFAYFLAVERIKLRYGAATTLFDRGDPRAAALLRTLFGELREVPNAMALAFGVASRLGWAGDRDALRWIATFRSQPPEPAVAASRLLARIGTVADLRAVLDARVDPRATWWATVGLVRHGEPATVQRLLRPPGPLRVELQHALAARGDPAARAALLRTASFPLSRTRTRIAAAVALASLNDPAGIRAATRIPRAAHRSARLRVMAAAALARVAPAPGRALLDRLASARTRDAVRLRAGKALTRLFDDREPLCALALDPHAPVGRRKEALEYLAEAGPLHEADATRLARLTERPETPTPVRIAVAGLVLPSERAVEVLAETLRQPGVRSWHRVDAAVRLRDFDAEAAEAALHAIVYDRRVWRLVRLLALQQIEAATPDLVALRRRVDAVFDGSPVLLPLRLALLDWPTADDTAPGTGDTGQ
jgi:hypothetical protein